MILTRRRLRHYLKLVAVPAHRKALTGLLLGDHLLSVERPSLPGTVPGRRPERLYGAGELSKMKY
jgi:hypothetical protein